MQQADETTFRPSDVARELNVTTNTVRNWTKRYNEFLSDGTRPEGRNERAFNRRDLAILHYVNQHVNEGYTHDYIAKRLPETTFSDDEVILPPETAAKPLQNDTAAPGDAIAPASALDASTLATLLQSVQSDTIKNEQIHVLQDEQRQQRADIRQQRILLYAIFLVMVLVLVAVVMLVAVMR